MKRTLTLCLTLLFTLLCAMTLSACGTKPPATERPSSLVIVRDGVCEHTIVYDADSLEARRQATTLRSTLRSLYGVSLTPVPDDETPIGEREILIGATNRPLSQQLLAKRPSSAAEGDLFYGYLTDKTSLALYGSSSVAWEKCWATLSPTCLKETVFTVLPLCDNTRYNL